MSSPRGSAAPPVPAPPHGGASPAPVGRFGALAGWAQRHRWAALVLWVAVVAAIALGSAGAGSAYRNDFSLPGTDSQRATDLFTRHGSDQAGDSVEIVLKDTAGVRGDRTRVEPMLAEVRQLAGVAEVGGPFDDTAAVSKDGTIAYASVTLDGKTEEVPKEDVARIIDTARGIATGHLQVEVGGEAARNAEDRAGPTAELAGIVAALVILVLLFGSVLAASLPLITALFAVGGAIGLIALASHVFTVADFTPPILMLVGLGVGVDYALLIFYRYRQELLAGAEPDEAGRRALDSAGRTVFFAGCTVIVALLGLVALGLGSLQGIALAVAVTVLITMAASLVLLPALLALFGGRIRRHVLGQRATADRKGRREGDRWRAMARAVQRRPLPTLLVGLLALLALSAPALGMRLGFADSGNDPAQTTSRHAYDLLAEGFGPGFNGPLVVLVKGDADAGETVRARIAATDGVAQAGPAMVSGDGALSTVLVHPTTSPQAEATVDLVHRLRDTVAPPLERATGAEILVGGATAASQDVSETLAERLPLFIAVVVGMSSLLLLLVFRSLWIPVKAAVLNLLSISAALGVITLVFQHGWFGAQPGPVEAFVPALIFAIVFGLSMDYEVFLVSRVHEEWIRTGDHSLAVREGLASTGKVITAAAAIMMFVFGAFVLGDDRMLQQFGLGLAVAILLDAVVIRCLIVPAALHLLGTRAWWLPARLARRLPEVSLERPGHR
ncbi:MULTISPECIES: MMPL family transporter [unclassified Streptomyces]|uniref:MMPL family transporter n=1 Tax=unclassified Streptomyces TaxID=2593676 RepID=UPI000DBA7D70|nr:MULTISPECIES: MMPL family transporter [unclassified Streptomyces]MYT75353.1 MMPL family transporter [Streptomyces sp. SID8367]RAJ86755.1 RND superfamily putative drug exporter [Streptomyces sp. PsTaAH-137]